MIPGYRFPKNVDDSLVPPIVEKGWQDIIEICSQTDGGFLKQAVQVIVHVFPSRARIRAQIASFVKIRHTSKV